ncbi:MAG: hypothetical protein ABT01_00390 [Clostridium sp. SCN 57-10]|nr:MAG: hypothetical protein ABT01_00390 [Clostridium sp. SCN 57-10]
MLRLFSAASASCGTHGQSCILNALIGLQQAKCAVAITSTTIKSKAENTQGGIVYDAALKNQDWMKGGKE